jgi:glycosyltransferase involved in cell wall biosynthesis
VSFSEPKISVIVPTYNREDMIGGCIEAILAQTMNDFEIIVVSDGSTDNTKEVVEKYHDPRLLFFEKENGGQASARNLGINKSRGKYISLCDDDDRLYPDHLMILNNVLDNQEDVGLAYSDAIWIYKDKSREPEVKYSQDFDKKSLENYNYIIPQTVMFRKSCLKNTDLFNEAPGFRNGLEDWEFFLRLSDNYVFSHIKKVTTEYTVHDGNSFHAGSGYDYNRAFFLVRTQRFQYLISKFGPLIFDHVDHMYPFDLVHCYINNGKAEESLDVALKLYSLFKIYSQKSNFTPLTLPMILFPLGLSSYSAGYEDKAKIFFSNISKCSSYASIKPQFAGFVNQYVKRISNGDLKVLITNCF